MPELADEVVAHLDALIGQYKPHIASGEMGYGPYLRIPVVDVGAACCPPVGSDRRYTRPGSAYRGEAQRIHDGKKHSSSRAVELLGVAQALRDDYAAGQMRSVEELVHADVFSDFLDMAKELLDKGFKDPAAVVAGSVLEEQLRQLAGKAGIAVEGADGKSKKAETLNVELGKQVYASAQQKAVTAWLGLRNDAAHPGDKQHAASEVALLIESVRDFTLRHPA